MGETERLREQLAAAVAATTDAYRHTSRLIRVLTVLGQPSSPAELVDQTLTVLSQIYAADVTATVGVAGGRLIVSSACGIPENDPAFTTGWPLAGAALEALTSGRAVTRDRDTLDLAADVPPSLATLDPASAVWVPAGVADELLVMYRVSSDGFPAADLPVLGSVAARLRAAVESRERSAAVERLATLGHRLSSRLDLPSMYEEILRILPALVDADYAGMVVIEGGTATLSTATDSEVLRRHGEPVDVARLPGWETLRTGGVYTGEFDAAVPAGSILAVPVLRDGMPVAVLYALRATRRPFRHDAIDSVTIFANYVSSALTSAELYSALGRSEKSLRLITGSISDLIAVVDGDGRLVYASPSHDRELALSSEALLGRVVTDLAHSTDRAALAAALADPAAVPKVEYRLRDGRGAWVWVETAVRPVPEDGTLVLSSRLIDDRRRLEAELRRRATHDPLTGVANRALTAERLDAALGRPDDDQVGLLFCDLDKFKQVNDRLGHEAGDALLLEVAARLRACVRAKDLLARFGGDEFVILLDGIDDLAAVTDVGGRVVEALRAPFWLHGEWVQIGVSVGGVLGVRGVSQAGAMLRDADAAMYAAKNAGRGRVEVFDAWPTRT